MPSFDANRYVTEELLKQNSHVRVYRALDHERDEQVILKVLKDDTDEPAVAAAMFDREIAALELLRHEHIVRKLRSFREGDSPVLVLEYVPGGQTLEGRIGRGRRPTLAWRIQALRNILGAVQQAHSEGVIHRDLSLSNILFDADENAIKLSDFGIAKLQRALELAPAQTLRGFYTLPYAAPEQVRGHEPSTRSDMYSFGVIMAAVLGWEVPPPTFARSGLETLLQGFAGEVVDPGSHRRILLLLRDLLSDDPLVRPNAYEVQDALKRLAIETGPSRNVVVRLSKKTQDALRQMELTRFQLAEDLNVHLKGRYDTAVDQETGESTFLISLYGESIRVVLRPDGRPSAPEGALFISNLERPAPEDLGRRRAGADELNITVSIANMSDPSISALPLIEALLLHHQEREDLKVAQGAREAFLEVPRAILEFERRQLKGLALKYRVANSKTSKRNLKLAANQTVRLQLDSAVRTQNTDTEEIPGSGKALWRNFERAFQTDLEGRANVYLPQSKRPFGTIEGFDTRTGVLHLRSFQRSKLPKEGELRLIDPAPSSALLRQDAAIEAFIAGNYVNAELPRRIMDPATNELNDIKVRTPIQAQLDPTGEHARILSLALAAEDFFLVQGPPGTGKTTLIVDLMGQVLTENPHARVLVTSQSNKAVDTILSRFELLGGPWRSVRYASEAWAEQTDLPSYDQTFERWLSEAKIRCREAMTSYVSQGEEQAEHVLGILRDWVDHMDTSTELEAAFLDGTSVFGATCSTAAVMQRRMNIPQFDWVIFDEAARATVAESLIPLLSGRRFVMVGDHKQLPPYLEQATTAELSQRGISEEEAKRSLFEKLFGELPERNRRSLRTQYRMHSSIAKLVGDVFYTEIGGLDTGISDTQRPLPLEAFGSQARTYWLNVESPPVPEPGGGTSSLNQGEVEVIISVLRLMSQQLPAEQTLGISIISPYAAQIRSLRAAVQQEQHTYPNLTRIRIGTVDSFQGEEDDVVICSLVKIEGKARFVTDPNRLNVTFSRAKSLLIIVGNYLRAQKHPRLAEVIHPTYIPADHVWSVEAVAQLGGQQ